SISTLPSQIAPFPLPSTPPLQFPIDFPLLPLFSSAHLVICLHLPNFPLAHQHRAPNPSSAHHPHPLSVLPFSPPPAFCTTKSSPHSRTTLVTPSARLQSLPSTPVGVPGDALPAQCFSPSSHMPPMLHYRTPGLLLHAAHR